MPGPEAFADCERQPAAPGDDLRAEIASLQAQLASTHASTSWRITAPMRAFRRGLDLIRGRVARQPRNANAPAPSTAPPPAPNNGITAELPAMPTCGLHPGRRTVIAIVDAASVTAIRACSLVAELRRRHDVIVLLAADGPAAALLRDGCDGLVRCPAGFGLPESRMDALAVSAIHHYDPLYVIADGVQTRGLATAFERAHTPVVALIHDFCHLTQPPDALHGLFTLASSLVFPARLVLDTAVRDYPVLNARLIELAAPAMPLPPSDPDRPSDPGRPLLVAGAGPIDLRSGIEFFLAAAASVQRRGPARPVRFLWCGSPGPGSEPYLDALRDQVRRSGLARSFQFSDGPALLHAQADLLLLSSRLDTFPEPAIEAAQRGIPVICFDGASGMAETLASHPATAGLVVPYLDAEAAAMLITSLAADPARRQALSAGMRAVAAGLFDIARYGDRLDRIGQAAAAANRLAGQDALALADPQAFDPALYWGAKAAATPRAAAIAHYLHASRLAAPRGRPQTGRLVRRPLPGFNPLTYAAECAAFAEAEGHDPLVHYIQAGRPPGPWQHQVIQPGIGPAPVTPLRLALHGHFHYPELLADLVPRLRRNQAAPDLILTTTSPQGAETLGRIVARFGVINATITVIPNRGRDVAPLVTAFGRTAFAPYDLVGHLHGKRSPQLHASVGETWRNFMWENLVGGEHPMLDRIAASMAADPSLGLVFPEDPFLNDWDDNRLLADSLAARMGVALPLPQHFDFPIGTMVWARPTALHPLQQLGLAWDDFPDEPLPVDGTILHTIERLLPFSAAKAGYRSAKTMVPGCVR